jgi:sulfur-oxidizing protein SoxX
MRLTLLLPLALLACAMTARAERPGETPAEMDRLTSFLEANMHERGQAKMDRLELDEVQRLCNRTADNPSPEQAKRLQAIAFPSGSLLGDWKQGEKIAQNGRGLTWSDKPGPAGGSCYNCHEISPKEQAHGTIGPSLARFGRNRGNGPDMQRYVYGKIYNAKAYNACSQMPRFGHSGTPGRAGEP